MRKEEVLLGMKFKLTGSRKSLKAVLQDEEGWGINDIHNYIEKSVVNEYSAVVDTDDPKSPILKKLLKEHKVTMVAAN